MHRPLKIMLVGRSGPSSPLRPHLADDYALEFTARRAASEGELRAVAREFSPDVVVSTETAMALADDIEWQALTLLSRQSPRLLVCALEGKASIWCDEPARARSDRRSQGPARDVPRLSSIPSTFERGADVAVLVDRQGWIRVGNASARRWLSPQRIAVGRHMHLQDLIGCLAQAAGDEGKSLPLVGLNFNGLALLGEEYGPDFAESIWELVSDSVQPRFARCGLMVQTCGEEYLVVLPHPSAAADAAVAALGPPQEADYGLSAGFERLPAANEDAPVLTEAAVSSPAHEVPEVRWSSRHPAGESNLSNAIARDALSVHYQPQFDLRTGRGCGVEALARWTLSTGETLAPSVFIPVAERTGLIGALGASILQHACATAAGWRGREAERLTLSVNVSARQLDSQYCRVLESTLKGCGLPALRLELEVAETALLDREASLDCLRQWKQLGVRIAVNHFGTNYSSLSYLSRWSVDRLKLDKSLIHRMNRDRKIAAVVRAVIALGAELDVEVMAEGVETEAQLMLLRDLGCTQVQGFLLARPMPAVQAQIALRKVWGNLPATVGARQ
jgi:EAL domain-containing protein (putative c-di-GMP-specific phosphodiesterase class I)